jgi:hypothetical protein
MHVYRWDLDRTYLDTDMDSVRSLVRHALEPAANKRNIPGAPALLRGLIESAPDCRVSILSGSPEQMRPTIEEKLRLDGVRFDQLVLKDSLRVLRRGQLRAVTGQVGYKLPQLFRLRAGLGPPVRETLFRDNSEVDALVYTVYADAVAGHLDDGQVARVMEAGGAYPDAIDEALEALAQLGRADIVEDIFIHVDRGASVAKFKLLGPRPIPVFSWFQAAVVLGCRGRLAPAAVDNVAAHCAQHDQLTEPAFQGLLQDLVRRGVLPAAEVLALLDRMPKSPVAPVRIARTLSSAREWRKTKSAPTGPQYLAFLRSGK